MIIKKNMSTVGILVLVVDHIRDDEVGEESNTKLVVVSPPSCALKLPFPRIISLIQVDQHFDFENFAFKLISNPIFKNTCFKVDVMIV